MYHRRFWTCPACDTSKFASADHLNHHLARRHADRFPDEQIRELVADSNSQALSVIPADSCPLCDKVWYNVDSTEDTHGTLAAPLEVFRKHLGMHLEKVALFAITPTFEGTSQSKSNPSEDHGAVSLRPETLTSEMYQNLLTISEPCRQLATSCVKRN